MLSALKLRDYAFLSQAAYREPSSDAFATQYAVASSYHGTSTSFDVTAFKDATGNLTLAICGTSELPADLSADGLILSRGVAYDQAAAMWNWWQRVSNSAGTPVAQYRLTEASSVSVNATLLKKAPNFSQ